MTFRCHVTVSGRVLLLVFLLLSVFCLLIYNFTNFKRYRGLTQTRKGYLTLYGGPEQMEDAECVKSILSPGFVVCVHDADSDIAISRRIANRGHWEPDVYNKILKMLSEDPKLGFIDLGGYVGSFALGVAKFGRKVVVVEPYEENLKLMYKAAEIDETLDNMVIVKNALYNRRGTGTLRKHPKNPADVRIKLDNKPCEDVKCFRLKDTDIKIDAVLADDILEVIDFDEAIMKIDIQGEEPVALQNATKLLDAVFIPAIFMQWEFFSKPNLIATGSPGMIQAMVLKMILFLKRRNYIPYDIPVVKQKQKQLDFKDWNDWPINIVWIYNSDLYES